MSKVLKAFHLEDASTDITLNLEQYVTLVCGDSGQGKSFLADKIQSIQEQQRSHDILIVNNYELLQMMPMYPCQLVIIDRMEQYSSGDEVWQQMLKAPGRFYIVYPRGNCCIPFNHKALASIVVDNRKDKLYFSLKY